TYNEGSVSLNELMDLVTQLTTKVGSLENELMNTKKVYGSALTKLVNRVKKLEKQVNTEKISDDIEVLLEEEETTELIEEPTELVEDQGSGEKGEQEVTTADTTLNIASVPFDTASATPEMNMFKRSPRRKCKKKGLVMKKPLVPMDFEEEVQRLKRAGQDVEGKPAKRQRTEEVSESVQEQTDELSQEQLNQMVIIVLDEGINVEALQTKYPIIGWEVHSDDTMQFWKIIRVGNHTEV
ncbi:hypothetical protein Tco_1341626, partial [Tanacetum coccineum]